MQNPEETSAAELSGPPPSRQAFAALRHHDFRLFWLGEFASLAGTQMQIAAVAWQVYLLSHSALALGLIGLFRVVPIILFSLWGGVVADALNRRKLLLVTETCLLLVSVVLAGATLSGAITVWMIYGLETLAGAALAFDNPARQALVPSLVPSNRLANALSLNSTVWQLGAVIGPSLAGIVIATRGVAAVYVLDVVSYLVVLLALFLIRPRPVLEPIQQISRKAAVEGLQFVRRTPIILQTMALDFVATFFGSAIALLPIFAQTILDVGSRGYGFLYAAPAAGAVLAGIVMSIYGNSIRQKGLVILIAVGLYALCTVVFGFSRAFPLSMLALAGVGASDTVSMILRQTVRQTVTPDGLRGRMTSVNMIFFMGGPQLGEFEAGVVGRTFGAPFSIVSGGIAALLSVILIARLAPTLRRYSS